MFILDRLLGHHAVDRMHLSPRRVHLIFIEKDRARHERLVAELVSRFGPLKDLPVRVEVRRGDAGRDSLAVLDELGAWGHPILGIFDSWGSVNVPLHVMSRHCPSRNTALRSTPSRAKPDFSSARCSAMFSVSVSASSLTTGVCANR